MLRRFNFVLLLVSLVMLVAGLNPNSIYADDKVAIYQYWHETMEDHFYTSSESDPEDGYIYQGIAFYVNENEIGTPIYRYWHDVKKNNFYTPTNVPAFWGFDNQGIAFYADLSETISNPTPIYCYWNETIENHYYSHLESGIEADGYVNGGVYFYASFPPTKTITVGDSGADYTTIQEAVNEASPGDTIEIDPGTYHEAVTIHAHKSGLTIEASVLSDPPVIDGADPDFKNPDWTEVTGPDYENVYQTTYEWPLDHAPYDLTAGSDAMHVYEDDTLLRGYGYTTTPCVFGTPFAIYQSPDDLNPEINPNPSIADCVPSNTSKPNIRIQGRFAVEIRADEDDYLYVRSADENAPSLHDYFIPVIPHLFTICAPDITIRNLVFKHSVKEAVLIENESAGGALIEECYFINNSLQGIRVSYADNVHIFSNFMREKGFYERNSYIDSKSTGLEKGMITVGGCDQTQNCKIAYNVISGSPYGILARGEGMEIHHNIISYGVSGIDATNLSRKSGRYPNAPSGYNHDLKIYNNIFHHAEFSPITLHDTEFGDIWFYRNIVYKSPYIVKDGTNRYDDILPKYIPKKYFYHNTFAFLKKGIHSPYKYAEFKTTIYRNNIFYYRWEDPLYSTYIRYFEFVEELGEIGKNFFKWGVGWADGPDLDFNLYWSDHIVGQGNHGVGLFKRWFYADNFRTFWDFDLMCSNTHLETNGMEDNPEFINKVEIAGAFMFGLNYDQFTVMDYQDIINHSGGYNDLFETSFEMLYNYFKVDSNNNSPAINEGDDQLIGWPDSETQFDEVGGPDIGAHEGGRDYDLIYPPE